MGWEASVGGGVWYASCDFLLNWFVFPVHFRHLFLLLTGIGLFFVAPRLCRYVVSCDIVWKSCDIEWKSSDIGLKSCDIGWVSCDIGHVALGGSCVTLSRSHVGVT